MNFIMDKMDPTSENCSSTWRIFLQNFLHFPPPQHTSFRPLRSPYTPLKKSTNLLFFFLTLIACLLLTLAGDVETNSGPLRILQMNYRSLKTRGKKEELAKLADKHNADVLFLSETWLRSVDPSPKITGFCVANR